MRRILGVVFGEGLQGGDFGFDLQGGLESALFGYLFRVRRRLARRPLAIRPWADASDPGRTTVPSQVERRLSLPCRDCRPRARRVRKACHDARSQQTQRNNCAVKKKRRRSRPARLMICWLLMISDVSARFVFAKKTAYSGARRNKELGLLRHSSNLGICSARRVLSRRTKSAQRTLRICAGVKRHLAACARKATLHQSDKSHCDIKFSRDIMSVHDEPRRSGSLSSASPAFKLCCRKQVR